MWYNISMDVAKIEDFLSRIPDESVQSCIAPLPPIPNGLQVDLYIRAIADILNGVRRVLASDGLCWVWAFDAWADPATGDFHRSAGLPSWEYLFLPYRIAERVRTRQWWLRDTIILDLLDEPYETIFMFTKMQKYFYNSAALRKSSIRSDSSSADDNDSLHKDLFGEHVPRFVARKKITSLDALSTRNADGRVTGADVGKESHATGTRTGKNLSDAYKNVDWGAIGAHPRSVWRGETIRSNRERSIERCIIAGTKNGDTILNPFGHNSILQDSVQKNGRTYLAPIDDLCEI